MEFSERIKLHIKLYGASVILKRDYDENDCCKAIFKEAIEEIEKLAETYDGNTYNNGLIEVDKIYELLEGKKRGKDE